MGRHRRTTGRATTGRPTTDRAADATVPYVRDDPAGPGGYDDVADHPFLVGYTDDDRVGPERHRKGAHRYRSRGSTVMRTGLLGMCAAVAMGAVAVATGLLPGGGSYSVGSDADSGPSDEVSALSSPSGPRAQGSTHGSPSLADRSAPAHPDRSTDRSTAPSRPSSVPTGTAAPRSPQTSAAPVGPKASAPSPSARRTASATPSRTPTAQPSPTPNTKSGPSESGAEAKVVSLVNQERNKAGCSPVRVSGPLADLADAFSDEMAALGFFDHTDPRGLSPWDRAAKAGVANLGGENIARGQPDATSVMDAWMHSSGHRANILNCDYHTIGVGVHFGTGGPWWTQDFGF